MAVFTPSWSGEAAEIVRYTEGNSSYKGGISTDPVMLSNGQIWSLSDKITSIDSNLKVLPAPLPDWFASLDWLQIRLFSVITLFIVFLIGQLFFLRWSKR
jgi:hypothetical protein